MTNYLSSRDFMETNGFADLEKSGIAIANTTYVNNHKPVGGTMLLRKIFLSLSAAAALTLVGCAHGLMRGSVAMKVSDTEAHVCMKDSKLGEKVTLFKNTCTGSKSGARSGLSESRSCEKVQLGYGTVTEVLNHHYSVVKFDSGVPFEEGTFVEKR